MFKRTFRLPSPALVISMVALALVLGGTAAAAAGHGDKAADTKLVKKLAPSLSVKHAHTADVASVSAVVGVVSYVKGNVVDAPANGGSGYAESPGSEADCPVNTVLIGSSAYTNDQGIEISPSGVIGTPPAGVRVYFDNFTNTDGPTNYAIAICAPVADVSNPDNLLGRKATRH
jgi:hypothetical protein